MNIENIEHKSKFCVNFDKIYDFNIKDNNEQASLSGPSTTLE